MGEVLFLSRKIALLFAVLWCMLSMQAMASEQRPLRIAQFPLQIQSRMTPAQNVQDKLETLVDRSLHIPLNGTLHYAEYIPEQECLQALADVQDEASGKRRLKDLLAPVAEKLQADLVIMPVLTGYEQYQTMSWYRWGRHITHSYAAVQIAGFDRLRGEAFVKGDSRQFHDEYSTQGEVGNMALEVMRNALLRAEVRERLQAQIHQGR